MNKALEFKPEELSKAYEAKRPLYESFTAKLYELMKDLLLTHDISVPQIEFRTKTTESFVGKALREGKKYVDLFEDLTDISGIRIIAYYLEDVEKIGEIIRTEFEVDELNSIDKSQVSDPDRFGYLSVHYVISLSSPRKNLTEWKSFSNLKAEIQVRTVLQHAWAAIDHKLRYKAAYEVPRSLRRQLFRLSALLELADLDFSDLKLRSEKLSDQYLQEVGKGELDIELNMASLTVYLESSEHALKWAKTALEAGFEKYSDTNYGTPADLSNLLKMSRYTGIQTISDFDSLLKDANRWGKKILAEFRKVSTEKGFVPTAAAYCVLLVLVLYGRRDRINYGMIEALGYREEVKGALTKITGVENPLQ
jgi:ppGpp synthetase/RelA/SpoT-type nucleotidyltranferase